MYRAAYACLNLITKWLDLDGRHADTVTISLKQTARNLRQAVDELIQVPVLGRIVAGLPLPCRIRLLTITTTRIVW